MCISTYLPTSLDFPGGSVIKNPPVNAGDVGSIPGLGRSSGRGNGNPFQYSFLGNPTDRGAWKATVQRATKSQTRLHNCTYILITYRLCFLFSLYPQNLDFMPVVLTLRLYLGSMAFYFIFRVNHQDKHTQVQQPIYVAKHIEFCLKSCNILKVDFQIYFKKIYTSFCGDLDFN